MTAHGECFKMNGNYPVLHSFPLGFEIWFKRSIYFNRSFVMTHEKDNVSSFGFDFIIKTST